MCLGYGQLEEGGVLASQPRQTCGSVAPNVCDAPPALP